MSHFRHVRIVPVFYRDLVSAKRVEFPGYSLMMDHLGAVMDHTRVIGAGHGGARRRGYRQHRCYSGDNHPYSRHGGLPDKGRQKKD
jgi:hypothetical protein